MPTTIPAENAAKADPVTDSMTDSMTGPVVFVGLGSNRGDRLALLRSAVRALAQHPDLQIRDVSAVFETRPVGPSEGAFLNAALSATTRLRPHAVLDLLLAIERDHGRVRTTRWAARTLDLDLLAYLESPEALPLQLADPRLTLPHPHLHERDFVLAPLSSIAPTLCFGASSVSTLLAAVPASARTIVRQCPEALYEPPGEDSSLVLDPVADAVVDPTKPRGYGAAP